MNPALIVLAGASSLFTALLAVKGASKAKFCVICASVSLTWLVLLALLRLGLFREPVIVALLMGESATGFYYLVEKRVPEDARVFRLPFLLTLTLGAYAAVRGAGGLAPAGLFLLALWLVFGIIYAWRSNPGLRGVAAKIIACCRDW